MAEDPVVMLTPAELRSLGIQDLASVIHPAYRSRYIVADGRLFDLNDLAYRYGGRGTKPGPRPVTLMGPDGKTPIVIAFDRWTEAAEVQDIALEAYEHAEDNLRTLGSVIDTKLNRELRGLPQADTFDARVREHQASAVARKRKNMVTGHHYNSDDKYCKGQAQQTIPDVPWAGNVPWPDAA